ncbi:N-acetylated-alpha-linked acidic dipeptidase 2-like [Procambarus clarkii]|uniref:N-acetylated-alpha-linked acidic dipeptidase 2-like n=1 Tax=Procambarus clarkii TaxID=6728 RepID=UPI0037444745
MEREKYNYPEVRSAPPDVGVQVRTAEERGALGVVMYRFPADYAPAGPDFVYPHSSYMPPSASPFGTVKLGDGDPLTPFYPAIESAFRIPEEEASLPKIPAQSISYDDAWQILSRMGGAVAPASWQGNLNNTYHTGPGLAHPGWKVNVDVNNNNTQTITYNVVGVITGHEEPDRYVILGNHLDAWLFGGLDPNSGTAAMLELSRVFVHLRNETGWRPRRSLVFCGWGAEEYMAVGSKEWTQQFAKQLSDRAVAYLNVDMALEGNYTLRTMSSPLLTDAVFESAKKVNVYAVHSPPSSVYAVLDVFLERPLRTPRVSIRTPGASIGTPGASRRTPGATIWTPGASLRTQVAAAASEEVNIADKLWR